MEATTIHLAGITAILESSQLALRNPSAVTALRNPSMLDAPELCRWYNLAKSVNANVVIFPPEMSSLSLTACFTVRSERSWFAGYKSKTSVTAVFKLAGGPINIMPPRSLCMDSTKADKWQADNISIRESIFMFFISYPSTQTIIIHLVLRSEEHTSELQSQFHLVCRL